jgi:membrane protein DedA with SNARE-associated domain
MVKYTQMKFRRYKMIGSTLTVIILGVIFLVLGYYLKKKWLMGISIVPFVIVLIGVVSLIIEKQ